MVLPHTDLAGMWAGFVCGAGFKDNWHGQDPAWPIQRQPGISNSSDVTDTVAELNSQDIVLFSDLFVPPPHSSDKFFSKTSSPALHF